MVVKHAYTVKEFEEFVAQPENAEWNFELIYGEIVKKMPTLLHGFIITLLSGMLFNYLRQNPIGRIIAEGSYGLPGDEYNNRIPDLSFISNEKPLVSKGAAPFMPDLAIEVQSPSQSDKFMRDKADYYLANGVRMVWIVYTEKHIVEVLTPDDRELLTDAHTLSGGDMLPGFSLPVREIFAQ